MTIDRPAPVGPYVAHRRLFSADRPLHLTSGLTLPQVRVAHETYGELNAARDNAVFVCHALTGDSHVARHNRDDDPGWWDVMIGPGRPIDTDHYFVICANVLGGCAGTTAAWPSGTPHTAVDIADMVAVHRALVSSLGVSRLRAVVGGSVGGMQTLEWLLRHPADADGYFLAAASSRQSADNLAWNAIARAAIRSDPEFLDGRYAPGGPRRGLGIARMIAHLTYLSEASLQRKFGRDGRRPGTRFHPSAVVQGDFAVESYLEHQADKFIRRFDANSYLRLMSAMDRFDAFSRPDALATADVLPQVRLFSFTQDRLYGPEHSHRIQAELAARGVPARHEQDETCDVGHDAFLLDVPPFLDAVAEFLRGLGAAPHLSPRTLTTR
ncbi:homoserine O-acetyltransferase [Streptomyces sp. LHD-70]|uniref:homoserine O-acetyltransferase MetX n=1 Tax=Streptomyces sp. LHD-70 TaxID=3072140 RepID=UPI00280CCFA6|nr:homoserine O-acetyltransferase [Streptomyces sp. LHD-70]MDQ8701740.1 homoserine O-acetyltransferase [Streptomyces sp. LHD-70]